MRFNYGFNYDVYMEIIWKYSGLCLCHQVQQVDCIWHTATNKDPNITRVFMFYRSKKTWNFELYFRKTLCSVHFLPVCICDQTQVQVFDKASQINTYFRGKFERLERRKFERESLANLCKCLH